MERGWDAAGRLEPLWARLPGRRDELARLTGIKPTTLSAYNSGGRRIGMRNAQRIAEALDVSLYDLGAPYLPEGSAGLRLDDWLRLADLARRHPEAIEPHRRAEAVALLRQMADDLEQPLPTVSAASSRRSGAG